MNIFQPLAVFTKDDNGNYDGYSPNVKGAFSYGKTITEATTNMKEAIEGVMETALEHGYNGVLMDSGYKGEEGEIVIPIPVEKRLCVAASIHLARERAGMNQEEFARKIGINRETVCRYERGKRMPSADTFLEILEAV
ncbi:MAG TPA: type II toxin-antitoxin system HicB family antitoxin [Acidobacteriota bacterium]|nr:type II toxin-antitoxin system HicB family antitoxin [Acidobacteriota bacterium]